MGARVLPVGETPRRLRRAATQVVVSGHLGGSRVATDDPEDEGNQQEPRSGPQQLSASRAKASKAAGAIKAALVSKLLTVAGVEPLSLTRRVSVWMSRHAV